MRHSNRLWLTALFLGLAWDFLFWKKALGVNFAIFAALCLIAGFLLLRFEHLRPARKGLWLLLPLAFFAAMTFIRQEPLSIFLAHGFTLFLMSVLALTFLGGRWLLYSLSDYVAGFFRLAGSMLISPLTHAIETRRQQAESGTPGKARRAWPILRGILLALPVVAVFAALLASADLIFAQKMDSFVALFRLEKLPEYILRGVIISLATYGLAGVFLHAASKSRDEELLGMEKPLLSPFLGFTESAIVLGSVTLLFAAFVLIQFQYFFGGQANITIEGYTFSEYARRGFGELAVVAFFSLLLFLGLSAITQRSEGGQRKAFSALGITLVTLVGVMLVSAFQRLLLYEAAYGFTSLRTYTHVFMLWLGLLLASVVALEILRRPRFFINAALLAALGFGGTLSLLNVEAFIVRQNVARAAQGEELDVTYLASLTADAVPALAEAYQSPSLPAATREAVGASLACISASMGDLEARPRDWRSFHLSEWWGENALRTALDELKGYKVDDGDWPSIVTSPGGTEYPCWTYD